MGIQVEELTRNLMPWGKEYIDFSFAGRHISEFGLVAVTSGDRYQFASSPEFEDETSNVNGVWGQYYWGTNFKTKTYSYSLATDGMTERQFEDFKRHFRPGHYGQFYEDAWFDRYCYVRVKATVDFSFIPFQEEVEIAGIKIPSRIYKGECKIQFIQDKPFMYSFYQVLDSKIANLTNENDNGKAALRMIYHSNIPARDSWTKNIKCATGSYFSLPVIEKITKIRKKEDGTEFHYFEYKENDDNTNLFKKTRFVYYYNPSTITSEANLEFTIKRSTTKLNALEWEPIYFNEIYDDFTNSQTPYNTISTTGNIDINTQVFMDEINYLHSFKYGLPEVSSDINKAIDIAWRFYQENIHGALVELQERLQEELINTRVLLWAIKILQKIQMNQVLYNPEQNAEKEEEKLINYENNLQQESLVMPGCLRSSKIKVYPYPIYNYSVEVDWFGYFNLMMLMMFAECSPYEQNDITVEGTFKSFYPYTLKFMGEQGQAFITYKCNYLGGDDIIMQEDILEENCSNIVASNYLTIDGGDKIDVSTGKIKTYHILGFNHGKNEVMSVDDIKLEYKYTYA